MSPRSRSVDSRQPRNNLILARNCLAITFIRDPNCSQLPTTPPQPQPPPPPSTTTTPCKRCSGLEYIDDHGQESGESFDEKTISEDITVSSSSTSSHESSPFTSLSSSSTSSSTSPPSTHPQPPNNNNNHHHHLHHQNGSSTINDGSNSNHDDKINCSSLLSTSSSSAVSSLSSSSPPCTCPTTTTTTGTAKTTSGQGTKSDEGCEGLTTVPPSSSIDFSGLELFTSFVQANYQCFWNPSLVSSVSSLNYRGFLLPATIIMIGSEYAYEVIRTAYARRIIRPPTGYLIQSLGDVPLVEMSLVGQTKFTPLTEAICKCINDVNQRSVNCFLGEIFDSIRSSYPNINPPTVDMIKKTLRSLQREGKVRFSAVEGYCLVKPSELEIYSSPSVIIGGGGGGNSSTIMEPISPSSTIKRESTRLYSSLMTPDEVISRLHGSPTSSAESAYYGSTNGNLITPKGNESSDVIVNWDFGIDNQAMLLDAGKEETGSDTISLRRSSSLRISNNNNNHSTLVIKGNRTLENGGDNVLTNGTGDKLLSNLSTTSSTTLTNGTNGGPFTRSKSLRMVNHCKEKNSTSKSMTIDSSDTSNKTDAITVKKPSLFTKFFSRLSSNGGGNGLTPPPIGGKSMKEDQQFKLNQRKLGCTDWNEENVSLQSSQESKSTQTIVISPSNNKSASLAVLHRNRSNRCYCTTGVHGSPKLSSSTGGELTNQSTGLIRKSLTLDSNSRLVKCKPYGINPTSCIYCETLRSISTSKSKRSSSTNHYNNHGHHPSLAGNHVNCDLIISPASGQHHHQHLHQIPQISPGIPTVQTPAPLTNLYNNNGIGSTGFSGYATIGSIVDPNCDKCLTSLTYCCTNIDCANITSSTGGVTSSSRLYSSSHYHHHSHPGQTNHQQHQPSSLLHHHQHLTSTQQQQQPPINEQQSNHNHLHHHSTSSSLFSRQSTAVTTAALSSSTPSSPPPPATTTTTPPYSRFTLGPTLRSSTTKNSGNTYFTSSRATPSSLINSTPSSPLSPSSSSTINTNHHHLYDKLSPISIQTNSTELNDRLTNGLSSKSSSLLTSQRHLITTIGTNNNKLDRSMVKVTPQESLSTSSTTTTTTTILTSPSIFTSTATKIEPTTTTITNSTPIKLTKELTNDDNLWNEIGGKQLEAELRETGITIGNSFNLKIQIASPVTNQQQSTESTTSTTTTTKTLLSNGLIKSFTNFEEKSADNLSKQLPSSSSSSKLISNQCIRPVSSPLTNLTSVTNCTSTINVCTVNRTSDNETSSANNQLTNQEIVENMTKSTSTNANNKDDQSTCESSGLTAINQQLGSSPSESESIDNNNEMNEPTTKLTNGTTTNPTKVDSLSSSSSSSSTTTTTTTDQQQQQIDSLTNGSGSLIKQLPTNTISDIRQKVAQAKAAFFNSSSSAASAGETVKITSTC